MSSSEKPQRRKTVFRRLAGWIAGFFEASREGISKPVGEVAGHVAVLFRPRGEADVRTVQAQLLARNIDGARQRMLSARLRSVAVQNVQSERAPKQKGQVAPRGKAIPSKVPRVLKSYRRTAHPPMLSPRLRILKLTTLRPANVIELTRALAFMRREPAATSEVRRAVA